MASPFALFRRHQKILTIILTGLAMFAFILLDQVSRMESTRVMPFLFAAMGAGAFWIWGEGKQGKADGTQILTGAVLGAVIGALPILTAPAEVGIPTSIGTISKSELLKLKQDREVANSFVRQAFSERENAFGFMLQQYLFGGNSTQEVVAKQLLLHEADRLGISIGNSFITEFVNEVSDKKLSTQAFRKIRSQLGLGEVQLFDLLREELRAQAAYRVINPVVVHLPEQYWQDFRKVNVKQSVDTTAIPVEAFAHTVEAPSEGALKELFEQFSHIYPMGQDPGFLQPQRRAIAWLETDMKKLVAEVEEKLKADDGPVLDAELQALYDERKEAYYKNSPALPDLDLPELGDPDAGSPDAPEPGSTPPADGDKTPTPEKPENGSTPEKPADDPDTKPDRDTPAKPAPESEPKPPSGDTPTSPPATDKPESDSPAESETPPKSDDDNSCQDEPATGTEKPANPPADTETKATTESASPTENETPPAANPDEAKTPSKPAETPAAAPDKPASETTDKPESPASADTPAAETPEATDKPTGETESTDKPETPTAEYESLDDVRGELLDLVKEERIRKLVDERVEQAVEKIGQLRRTLRAEIQSDQKDEVTDENYEARQHTLEARRKSQEAELGKRLAENAATWAVKNGFQFSETEPLSQQELVDHEDYGQSIGVARDPLDFEAFARSQFQQRPQQLTVPQRLFSASSALFVAEVSEDDVEFPKDQPAETDTDDVAVSEDQPKIVRKVKFVWWVTRDVEAHVATGADPGSEDLSEEELAKLDPFDELGVRKQVEKAYRLREARPIAKERAEKIAAMVVEELKKPGDVPGEVPTMADAVAEQSVSGHDVSFLTLNREGRVIEANVEAATLLGVERKSLVGANISRWLYGKDNVDKYDEHRTKVLNSGALQTFEVKMKKRDGTSLAVRVESTAIEGDDEGLCRSELDKLTVLPSPLFSWLNDPNAGLQPNPFAQQSQVEFGRIAGVDGAGDEFMRTVTEMQVGEVKAIPNFDRSVYYVVHVKTRFNGPEDTMGFETMQQQFMEKKVPESPLYGGLARSQSSEIRQQWMTQFLKRYDVDPEKLNSI